MVWAWSRRPASSAAKAGGSMPSPSIDSSWPSFITAPRICDSRSASRRALAGVNTMSDSAGQIIEPIVRQASAVTGEIKNLLQCFDPSAGQIFARRRSKKLLSKKSSTANSSCSPCTTPNPVCLSLSFRVIGHLVSSVRGGVSLDEIHQRKLLSLLISQYSFCALCRGLSLGIIAEHFKGC